MKEKTNISEHMNIKSFYKIKPITSKVKKNLLVGKTYLQSLQA